MVSLTATATDLGDPSPVMECSSGSNSRFPIGDTTVTCTAADAAGNRAIASFVVHVRGAVEQTSTLVGLVAATNAKQGIVSSLDAS